MQRNGIRGEWTGIEISVERGNEGRVGAGDEQRAEAQPLLFKQAVPCPIFSLPTTYSTKNKILP